MVEVFLENCSFPRQNGRVGDGIGKGGHYVEAVSDERTDEGFVGVD